MKKTKTKPSVNTQRLRPPLTPEARENQLISLAMDLVEQRLRDGTASSAEVVQLLKRASAKERIEQEIMERQKELMEAKTEAIRSTKRSEELYEEAMRAMRKYSGQEEDEEDAY